VGAFEAADDLIKSADYQKAIRFADDQLRKKLSGYIEQINTRYEKKRIENIYNEATRKMTSAVTEKEYNHAYNLFESIKEYKDSASCMHKCLEKAKECRNNSIYFDAIHAMNTGGYHAVDSALVLFKTIRGWKDVDDKIPECEALLAELRAKEEAARIKREQEAEAERIRREQEAEAERIRREQEAEAERIRREQEAEAERIRREQEAALKASIDSKNEQSKTLSAKMRKTVFAAFGVGVIINTICAFFGTEVVSAIFAGPFMMLIFSLVPFLLALVSFRVSHSAGKGKRFSRKLAKLVTGIFMVASILMSIGSVAAQLDFSASLIAAVVINIVIFIFLNKSKKI
jgi:hypothetical protein